MTEILAVIENNLFEDMLSRFCNEEGYNLVFVEDINSVDIKKFIFFITDKSELVDTYINKQILVCLITSTPPMKNGIFYLQPSFDIIQLRFLMNTVYYGKLVNNYYPSTTLIDLKKEYVIDNDYFNIDRLVATITYDLINYYTFSVLEKLRIGLSEILTNAIEHGNLGITGAEKFRATEDGTFYDLIKSKLADEEILKLKTRVAISYSNGNLKIIIKDSGKGFDCNDRPDPISEDRLLDLHGRGILIAKMYYDSIEYSSNGTVATLKRSAKK